MLVVENLPYRSMGQDLPRVTSYLQSNPDDEVRSRQGIELRNAWETGRVYALIHDGKIVGTSLLYAFEMADFAAYEIGTVHIHENFRGLGLQEFINALQIFQTCAIEETDPDAFELFAVANREKASFHVLANKLMMKEAPPSSALSHLRAQRGLPFDEQKAVLFCDAPSVLMAAKLLRTCHQGGSSFLTPKNGIEIKVTAPWFSEEFLSLEDNA